MTFRVTYSVLSANLEELHQAFEGALDQVTGGLGQEFPCWAEGRPWRSGELLEDRNPADRRQLLGRFHLFPIQELDVVMAAARRAQKGWAATPHEERAALLERAADLISARRFEIAAIMTLEAGKNRIESLGDVEESADLMRYYAGQLREAQGFVRALGQLSPNERTRSVLRPYGVFVVISPFNFPLALAAGMSAGALLGGNAVILKPSQETPWCAQKLWECLHEAGLPPGLFQLLYGRGPELGRALVEHPGTDGVVFTGSKAVGLEILRNLSKDYPKPCILEMGGKNPAVVCAEADLEKAVEGCWRSAFGLSGQKCSALSRLYLHHSLEEEFLERFLEKTARTVVGDPAERETFVGPLINRPAVERHLKAVEEGRKAGEILAGGEDIRSLPPFQHGHFAQPTVVRLPHPHALWREEVFTPFLLVDRFETLEEALGKANDSPYGLTAGIFSENPRDVERFMTHMQAGVLYANRRSGATTGAWPGVQSFCGWKGSGSSGKGGCGPYYLAQFMREQSQTRME